MKDCNCIFCKIGKGDIPSNTIFEDEDFRVILDANPATKGHTLIIPKEHYSNIYEMDTELLGKAVKLAQKVIMHETNVLNCEGYQFLQNNGEAAGQTVFHFHMHLIPRYKTENEENLLTWNPQKFSEEELQLLCKEMKMNVKF